MIFIIFGTQTGKHHGTGRRDSTDRMIFLILPSTPVSSMGEMRLLIYSVLTVKMMTVFS